MKAELSPLDAGIFKIKQPNYPEFAFEYHPQKKKVYLLIDDHTNKITHAQIIAEHVENTGQAVGFVQTWLRGYHFGKAGRVISEVQA